MTDEDAQTPPRRGELPCPVTPCVRGETHEGAHVDANGTRWLSAGYPGHLETK